MKQLLTYWSVDVSSVIFFTVAILFFVLSKSFSNKKVLASIFILLAICFCSPLHLLSEHYLFSAHMIVHVILLLCIGPLMIMSLQTGARQFHPLFNFLKQYPVFGWSTGIGIMWLWHIPVIFNFTMPAMHHSSIDLTSIIEFLSLVIGGMIFSAPIIHPNKEYRMDTLSGVVYLFTACIGCSLLGLLITFAPAGTYHHFLSMHDNYGLNKIILNDWGITQSTDQQAAGLIMWIPCCLIYVTAAMYLLVNWFREKEETIFYSNKL